MNNLVPLMTPSSLSYLKFLSSADIIEFGIETPHVLQILLCIWKVHFSISTFFKVCFSLWIFSFKLPVLFYRYINFFWKCWLISKVWGTFVEREKEKSLLHSCFSMLFVWIYCFLLCLSLSLSIFSTRVCCAKSEPNRNKQHPIKNNNNSLYITAR